LLVENVLKGNINDKISVKHFALHFTEITLEGGILEG